MDDIIYIIGNFRQRNFFVENSIEAGIGPASCLVEMASSTPWWSRARSCSFAAYQLLTSLSPTLSSLSSFYTSLHYALYTQSRLVVTHLAPLARKSLFSILVVLCCSFYVRSSAPVAVPAASSAFGWSSVFHRCCLVGR
jgi:hypothetical protein